MGRSKGGKMTKLFERIMGRVLLLGSLTSVFYLEASLHKTDFWIWALAYSSTFLTILAFIGGTYLVFQSEQE